MAFKCGSTMNGLYFTATSRNCVVIRPLMFTVRLSPNEQTVTVIMLVFKKVKLFNASLDIFDYYLSTIRSLRGSAVT